VCTNPYESETTLYAQKPSSGQDSLEAKDNYNGDDPEQNWYFVEVEKGELEHGTDTRESLKGEASMQLTGAGHVTVGTLPPIMM